MKKRKLLKKIEDFMELKEILVIRGARQVGKTTLMKMLIENLKKKDISDDCILYLDLEYINLLNICNNGVTEI